MKPALFVWVLAALQFAASGVAFAEKPKLVVMPLQASGLPEPAAAMLDELLVDFIRKLDQHEVIGKTDIDSMLGLENMKDQLGCDDVTCAAEIGGALGAEFLVAGRVAKMGDSIIVVLKLINSVQSKVLGSVKHKAPNDENVYDKAIEDAVLVLFGVKRPKTQESTEQITGQISVTTQPPGAVVFVDDERAGFSPVLVSDIGANARHTIRLEAEGYVTAEKEVIVLPNDAFELDVVLDEQPTLGRAGTFGFVGGGVVGTFSDKPESGYGAVGPWMNASVGYVLKSGWAFSGVFGWFPAQDPVIQSSGRGGSIGQFHAGVGVSHVARGTFTLAPQVLAGLAVLQGETQGHAGESLTSFGPDVALRAGSALNGQFAMAPWVDIGLRLEQGGVPPLGTDHAGFTSGGSLFLDFHQPVDSSDGQISTAPIWLWITWGVLTVAQTAVSIWG